MAGLRLEADALVQITIAALRSDALLPVPCSRSLVLDPPVAVLTDEERALLPALDSTDTVVRLATQAHRSGRTQTRRLHDLYQRLGVANRQEAVDWYRRQYADQDDLASEG